MTDKEKTEFLRGIAPTGFIFGPCAQLIQNRASSGYEENRPEKRSVSGNGALKSHLMARATEKMLRARESRTPTNSAYLTGLELVRNRAAVQNLSKQEAALLEKDENQHLTHQSRHSDKDCAPLPLYIPDSGLIRKTFMDAVKQNLAAGMNYRSAWLKARQDNPVAFGAYLHSHSNS